jgi:signal transduction histidine kinase
MNWGYQYTPYIWPAIASVVFLAVLAIYGWRRRSVPGAVQFAVLMFCGMLWALGSALELASKDLAAKILWAEYQSAWQVPTVTAGLWFALEYADLRRWLIRRNFVLATVPPILWLLLTLTNPIHHLLWSAFSFEGTVHLVYNAAAWILLGYATLLALTTVLVFAWLFWRSPLHRLPVALCLCGQVVVRAVYFLEKAGAIPVMPVDPFILTFNFTAAMYTLALFRFRLFNLIPIARGTVIDQMREGMMVLDGEQRIMDLNPAAERILGVPAARARGGLLADLLPGRALGEQSEITLGTGEATRHFAIHHSALNDRRGLPVGDLVLLDDVTRQKHAQLQLLEQQRALATLQERDRIARELHDSLGQVLGYVKMQAQAARQLLARDRVPEADGLLAGLVAAAQEAHADVRGYILGARSGMPAGSPFVPALEEFLRRFSEAYGIAAKLSVEPGFTGEIFEPMVEAQLSRIIQETLTNVRKHARASQVSVRLVITDDCAEATVQDDGAGFDPETVKAAKGQRFGLLFMRERAHEVGGTVDVRSAPGEGAKVVIRVPVRKEQA